MNTTLLKSIIVANNDTQVKLAEYLGIQTSTLSFKITGKTDFTQSEIRMIIVRYNLTPQQVLEIFFNQVRS